jgi:hypothetical protein
LSSDRKIKANRANARASTGPKTAQGRARASRNAFRHGLSLPICYDAALLEEVETLARELAGTNTNAKIQEVGRRVAEAQVDLRRVRYARHQALTTPWTARQYNARAYVRMNIKAMKKLLRGKPPEVLMSQTGARTKDMRLTSDGPQKFALVLSQNAKQLLALDRYERRVLLRRNAAIRELDSLRVQSKVDAK